MTILREAYFDSSSEGTTAAAAEPSFDVNQGTHTDITVAAASAVHGGFGVRQTSAAYAGVGWNLANAGLSGTADEIHVTCYVTKHSDPSQNSTFLTTNSDTAGSAGQIRVRANNSLVQLRDNFSAVGTTSATFNPGDTWRFDWVMDFATNSQSVDIYYGANLEGSTPDETLSGSMGNAPNAVAIGAQAAATGFDFGYDSFALGDAPIGSLAGGGGTPPSPIGYVLDGVGARQPLAAAYVLDGTGTRVPVDLRFL